MITEFSLDELDWMKSVMVDDTGKILSTEAIENPKASLLRGGVLTEKCGGIYVARKFMPLFRVKPGEKPKPKPETKTKRVRLTGLDFIAPRIAFYEAIGCDSSDVIRRCLYSDGAYEALDKEIRAGLESKSLKEAALCASAARVVFLRELDEAHASHTPQLHIHAVSEVPKNSIRLMRFAKKECSKFGEVQAKVGDNVRSVVFSGPLNAAVAAAVMYTYTCEVANSYARSATRECKTRKEVKNAYIDGLNEATKWLA